MLHPLNLIYISEFNLIFVTKIYFQLIFIIKITFDWILQLFIVVSSEYVACEENFLAMDIALTYYPQ